MATISCRFDTPEEAQAFSMGIEYVNDSAISVLEIQDSTVHLTDEDADEPAQRDFRRLTT